MATEDEQRAAVIAEAKTWLGTPWRHAADIKGQAVDCGMLLARCFIDCGIVAPFDPRPYERTWFMHHSEERFVGWIIDKLGGVEVEYPRPGDVIVYRWGRCYSHGALLVEPQLIIHAAAWTGACRYSETFEAQLDRPRKCFDMWASRR
jgi:cell wall-associated NlpC family hydrolase